MTLFDLGGAVPEPRRPADEETGKPVWTKLWRGGRDKCQRCVQRIAGGDDTSRAATARYRRRHQGADLYLCSPCAQDQKVADGFAQTDQDGTS
ncbi:hypothetical protein [Microbispora sp. KK1-11]|uniref:hypothetical protein n=1 Tax=Microbispora sp. KK1-11 TaxID=2053005 RepID=UPI0011574E7D|nr:hypothetical protein [Microbispora sp. KK1-11]TQS29149.1 hypothetical protein FLW16_12465 [Microbispora sp. KK1-11]